MTDRITIVTTPDDILIDGIRILLVDLTDDQSSCVSTALTQSNVMKDVIVYLSNNIDWDWIIDKKQKSDLIIFNAESENCILVGYLSAQPNSHYFGTLKDLYRANNRAIYTTEDIIFLLENISK